MTGEGDAFEAPVERDLRVFIGPADGVFAQGCVTVGFVKQWRRHDGSAE
jgi:hypothetical protein